MSTLIRVATRWEASCGEQMSFVCGRPDVGRRGHNQAVGPMSLEAQKKWEARGRAICERLEVT